MDALLSSELRSKKRGRVFAADVLKHHRIILVYCSAHWCPPCRGFTPQLAAFFSANAARLKFEVVFLSNDRDEKSFSSYFDSMPWDMALGPEDPAGPALMSHFDVRGIPALLVFSRSGALLTKLGVESVMRDPDGAAFPWVGAGGDSVGRRIRLLGLAARSDLNGKHGIVAKLVPSSGRLQVTLEGGAEELAVKRENVEFIDD